MTRRRPRHHRGFTLIETVLAVALGLVVIGTAAMLFGVIERTDRMYDRQSTDVADAFATQQVMRTSFMSLVLLPQSAAQQAEAEAQAAAAAQATETENEQEADELVEAIEEGEEDFGDRARMILEFDGAPTVGTMVAVAQAQGSTLASPFDRDRYPPQRLEMVLSAAPAADALRGIEQWSIELNPQQLGLSAPPDPQRPPDEGGVRGVFELRPDHARENLMRGRGLLHATQMREADPLALPPDPARGWTLWWRPIYNEEFEARQLGETYDIDLSPELLVEAIPLMSGLIYGRWTFTATDPEDPTRAIQSYEGQTLIHDEAPAYAQFEFQTTTGIYGSWLFELGWTVTEVEQIATGPADGSIRAANAGDAAGDPGGGPGGGLGGGGRGGGGGGGSRGGSRDGAAAPRRAGGGGGTGTLGGGGGGGGRGDQP